GGEGGRHRGDPRRARAAPGGGPGRDRGPEAAGDRRPPSRGRRPRPRRGGEGRRRDDDRRPPPPDRRGVPRRDGDGGAGRHRSERLRTTMARRPTTAARRYAEAAFELAERDGTHDAWLAALTAAGEALTVEAVLRIVDNPAIPLQERQAAVGAILGGPAFERLLEAAIERLPAPEADPPTVRRQVAEQVGRQLARFVGLLVERRRVALLPRVADAYRRLVYARRD